MLFSKELFSGGFAWKNIQSAVPWVFRTAIAVCFLRVRSPSRQAGRRVKSTTSHAKSLVWACLCESRCGTPSAFGWRATPPRLFQEENLRGIGLAGLPATSRSCLCGTAYAVLLGIRFAGRTPCFASLKSGRSYWLMFVFARLRVLPSLSFRADVLLRPHGRCFAYAKPDALTSFGCLLAVCLASQVCPQAQN